MKYLKGKTMIALLLTFAASSTLQAEAQTAPAAKAVHQEPEDRGYNVKVGDQAPDDFELVLNDGRKTTLKELRGKVVVLQFTASWCVVCRREMPHLEADLWKTYQNKSVVLIGVDRDEPLEKVQKFHDDMKITYPLALDPGAAIFERFAQKKAGVTRNVVIDQNGRIAFLTRLYDEAEFGAMLKTIDGLTAKQNLKASL